MTTKGDLGISGGGTYGLFQRSDNMVELMLWTDLTITGGGLTKYETTITGTPCIIVSQITHQTDWYKEFAEEGATLNLGFANEGNEADIFEELEELLRDDVFRVKMSKRGKKLVGERGIKQAILKMPSVVCS